jgi:Tetraspanin family
MLAHVNPSVALFDSPNPSYMMSENTSNLSLSVNYIPSKFSKFRNRKGGKYNSVYNLPKEGAGLQAFKSNEARMPQGKGRLKWNKFKWVLFVTNSLVCFPPPCPIHFFYIFSQIIQHMIYSLVALVVCLLTWFDVWEHADVIRVANNPELILSTVAACVGILTSVIGWAGILLNNRGFLAWYTFLTWMTFAFLLIPGYLTYKHRTFNLEGKINAQWSRGFDAENRLRVQNQLNCCGYFSPYIEATVSQTCYSRTVLPGCKGPFLAFQKRVLLLWYTVVFLLVPPQLFVMVAGLLCSNHITYRFGKGMMPEAYRLNMSTMAIIMDNYAKYVGFLFSLFFRPKP